jgi:circadian clock protein KaiC
MDHVRISTGITGLDALFDGGFIKGRSYLLTGESGTGKTVACLQFLVRGLARGEKALYVTVDERPAEILAAAAAFSWDLQPYIQEKSLAILDAAGGSATDKGIDPQKIVADLGHFAKSLGATLLIIDPITPLLQPANPTTPAHVHARSLLQLIQSQINTTTLFTSHDVRGRGSNSATRIEQFLASGVLVLKTTELADRCERTIYIKKMRYTPVAPGDYPFAMVNNEGIVLIDRPSRKDLPRKTEPQFFQSFELEKQDS